MTTPRFPDLRTWLPASRRCAAALLFGVATLSASDALQPVIPTYLDRPEVQAFIQSLVGKHRLDAQELARLLGAVRANAEAIRLVAPPAVPVRRSWRVYRSRFIEPQRIRAGVAFWKEHAAELARTEKETGVPAEIIVGIIGVETLYGRNMGRFPVLETLTTLAFDYPEAPNKPRRSAMFLQELEEYLVWCRDTRQDPGTYVGSYTGAIGIPQFLPSSIRAYAVDQDGDGRIDLRGSATDAIGSVASYLRAHGWQPGRPAAWRATASRKALTAAPVMADGTPELRWRLRDVLDAGFRPQGFTTTRQLSALRKREAETPVLLIDLPSPERPTEYRIGLHNFYVITRYNRSFFYAAAVVDLGQAVRDALRRKSHN